MIHVIGVDPGLVHTGVVSMLFGTAARELAITPHVINGPDAEAVRQVVGPHVGVKPAVFIEGYKPRSHFDSDNRMVEAVGKMKRALPKSQVLLNTGVKKVIREPLMKALGVWDFDQVTHHQDLRSAARIALLGMTRDEELNLVLADFIRDHIDRKPWRVFHG